MAATSGINERVLALLCRLSAHSAREVVDALDVAAILDLGNDEMLDCIDELVLLGLVERVIGGDADALMVRLTALGEEGCASRFAH
jgi:DNA polymerase III gamma/tau subunit